MTIANAETVDYVLDMLEQLGNLARRDGFDRLAGRIETVVVAERSDPGKVPARSVSDTPKLGQA